MMGIPILGWVGIAGLVIILGLGTGLKIEAGRLTTSKAETVAVQGKFNAFVSTAKALGDIQNVKAKATDDLNKQLMEKKDAQLSKGNADLVAMYAKYRGLRNSTKPGSNSSQLPSAPTVTSSTPRTCFDTTKLANAMGVLETGVPNITQQGDVARLKLSTAVEWAQSIAR